MVSHPDPSGAARAGLQLQGSPHHHRKVKKWASENNVELVFTPTYASWLNRIECHFGPLRKFVLEGSDFAKHQDLGLAIQAMCRSSTAGFSLDRDQFTKGYPALWGGI
ncbi:transposase [Paenibacillus sp. Dod16]|uniref:transposase n=1 Tax=Paenibacillus sp. Dod16 TaxID=3416392 RepID=UPI003CEC8ED2